MQLLVVGIAADGQSNKIFPLTDLETLNKTLGGNYTQRSFITPTASSLSLDYYPFNAVSDSWNNKRQLFQPTVSDNTLYFGSVGGSGQFIDLKYTPYLGVADILTSGKLFLESGSLISLCRIGGTKATAVSGQWAFESIYRGSKYNNLTITSNSSGITVSGLEPNFGTRTYYGYPELIESQINTEARLGSSPVYLISRSDTLDTFTVQMSGGTNGVVNKDSIIEFLENETISNSISHVAFLGPLEQECVDYIINYVADSNRQPRLFMFNSPVQQQTIEFIGREPAYNTYKTYCAPLLEDQFLSSIYSVGTPISGTLSLVVSGSPKLPNFFTTSTSPFNINNHSANGGLLMFPAGSGIVTFEPKDTTKLIKSFGFWVSEGQTVARLKAYLNGSLIETNVAPTNIPASGMYFFAHHYRTPINKIVVDIASGIYSRFAIDDLSVFLVNSIPGRFNELFYYINEIPSRTPFISSFLGEVDITIGNRTLRRYAVEAVADVLVKNNNILTNQKTKALELYPKYTESELEFAYLNGFSSLNRFIGSEISVYKATTLDTNTSFVVASKISEVTAVASSVSMRFIGQPLKEGAQSQIADQIKAELLALQNITIGEVIVDYIEGRLRINIEAFVYSEITKISFTVRSS
jgi:hypothetical protein